MLSLPGDRAALTLERQPSSSRALILRMQCHRGGTKASGWFPPRPGTSVVRMHAIEEGSQLRLRLPALPGQSRLVGGAELPVSGLGISSTQALESPAEGAKHSARALPPPRARHQQPASAICHLARRSDADPVSSCLIALSAPPPLFHPSVRACFLSEKSLMRRSSTICAVGFVPPISSTARRMSKYSACPGRTGSSRSRFFLS
jgi:hypothetical protein